MLERYANFAFLQCSIITKTAGTCDNIWIISFVVSTIFQGGVGKNGMECGGCISSNIPCRVGCF